jgi:hypothetical protein
LKYATQSQRADFTYNNIGIRWEEIDEDLSFEGFMQKKNNEKPALYHLFKNNPELDVLGIARRLGVPQSVMASCLCGIKKPSLKRRKEVEGAIHEIDKSLCAVKI